MFSHRGWVVAVIVLSTLPFIIFGGFNYLIDPMWCFSHSNNLNKFNLSFDERQQKTNRVTYSDFDYDALIIGNSRETYINQNDFINLKSFNYAASGMALDEYNDYIEYAKKANGKNFKYIIIGLDLFSYHSAIDNKSIFEPKEYIRKSNQIFYRYNVLLSVDCLKYSFENINAYKATSLSSLRKYTRDNVVIIDNKDNLNRITSMKTAYENAKKDLNILNQCGEKKVNYVNLQTYPISPQRVGNSINLYAFSIGSSNPQYKFIVRPKSGGQWTVIQDFSSKDNCSWMPSSVGDYYLGIYARDASSLSNSEAYKDISFRIVDRDSNTRCVTSCKKLLEEIRANNKDTKFIIFINPAFMPYDVMVNYSLWEQLIRDTVDVFGGVYNFNYFNSVTINQKYFKDRYHFTPNTGTLIANKVSNNNDTNLHVPQDFGVYVTNSNLDNHLNMIKNNIQEYSVTPPKINF